MRNKALRTVILLAVAFGILPAWAAAGKVTTTTNASTTTTKVTNTRKLPPAPTPSPAAAQVSFCSNDAYSSSICNPVDNAFSINTSRDLTIFVAWQNVTGAHVQKIVFIMPNGSPYQAISTSFDTLTGQGLQSQTPPTVANVLPVSGTWIQQRAIVGAWTVQVFLDEVFVGQSTLNFY